VDAAMAARRDLEHLRAATLPPTCRAVLMAVKEKAPRAVGVVGMEADKRALGRAKPKVVPGRYQRPRRWLPAGSDAKVHELDNGLVRISERLEDRRKMP